MSIPYKLKRKAAKLVLRGPLAKAWIRGKARKLDRRFSENLLLESKKPPIDPPFPAILNKGLRSILFICDNMWEDYYLLPELRKICPVEFLNLRPALKPLAQPEWAAQTRTEVQAFDRNRPDFQPDLIFFYARPALLSEEVFDQLRRRWRCPVFGMNLDDKLEFLDYRLFSQQPGNYEHWARFFDLNITNTAVTTDWYKNRGLQVYYMPQGFRSRAEFPYPENPDFEHEISFVGTRKSEREELLEHLRRLGIEVSVFGHGWPGGKSVAEPERVFRVSQLNLGIGLASPSTSLTTTKGRDFECPGAGACYLTTYNWELAAHYDLGKEILCYRNVEELAEIYAFYRRRPENCLKIAQAAYLRCQREHTWERRFRRLFGDVGLLGH